MVLIKGLQTLYSNTIDRSKFREVASRVVVFTVPFLSWGREPLWWGMIFVTAGILIRGWAAGHLYKDQKMAASGPYLLVRHPLYLGSCLLALGLIVVIHHWAATLLLGGITALQYWHTIRHEEKNLLARFGRPYAEFCKQVGPLWPTATSISNFYKSIGKKGVNRFSFRQYLKNREYEALLGVLAVFAILCVMAPQSWR